MSETTPVPVAAPVAPAAPAAAPTPVVSTLSEAPPAPVNPMAMSDADLSKRYVAAIEVAPADVPAVDVPAAEPAEATTEAPSEPTAPDAPAPDAPPLATVFSVADKEGELEIPRDLTITFKAGGKDLTLPLDRVVRMAQSAPQAEQFRQQAEALPQVQQYAQTLEQRVQSFEQEIANNNTLYERMLRDPDAYVAAVQAYQQMNAPESQLARSQAELAQLRAQQQQYTQTQQMQQQTAQAQQIVATRIAPAIEALAQQHPSIDQDEMTDRFYRLTAPLTEARPDGNGTWIPPQKLGQVEQLIQQEMAQWAGALHAKRTATATAVQTSTKQALTKAQADAQQAKRTLARAVAPARTPAAPDVARTKPIKTSADAMEASLAKVRQMIGSAA